jgi:hypothetical protein
MKWPVYLVLAAACQSGSEKETPSNTTVIQLPKADVTDAYRADITTLCDVVKLSGADQKPKDERWTVTAMYLGSNLKTPEGKEFMVAIKPLRADVKALALETESKRVGLAACPLADEWREAAEAAAGPAAAGSGT